MAESLGRGMFRIVVNDEQRIAFAAGPPEARWVFVDGQTYLVDVTEGGGRPRAGRLDADALSSPMPATVVKIHVEPGQRVAAGDMLITLEAMKMELPIRAPRDASVRTVACREGELVSPGVPLLELD